MQQDYDWFRAGFYGCYGGLKFEDVGSNAEGGTCWVGFCVVGGEGAG